MSQHRNRDMWDTQRVGRSNGPLIRNSIEWTFSMRKYYERVDSAGEELQQKQRKLLLGLPFSLPRGSILCKLRFSGALKDHWVNNGESVYLGKGGNAGNSGGGTRN